MAFTVLIASGSVEKGLEMAALIADCHDAQVVGVCYQAARLSQQVAHHRPDLLVLHVPSWPPLEPDLFREIREQVPTLRILAVGCVPEQVAAHVRALAPWGLSGCVCQEIGPEVREAVCVLGHGGLLYLCPQASRALVTAYRHHLRQRRSPNHATHRLSTQV